MEKGSFHFESVKQTEIIEPTSHDVSNIPIPSKVPPKVKLDNLPNHILRSGAVDALMNQNDDLMARLSVSIRRNSILEEKVNQIQKSNEIFQKKTDILKDQVLILDEKAKNLETRYKHENSKLDRKSEQLKLYETKYEELYQTAEDRQNSSNKSLNLVSRRLKRFQKYRQKMTSALQVFRRDIKFERQVHRDEIAKLTLSLQNFESKFIREEMTNHEFKAKLGEAATHIQDQAKEFRNQQTELINNYEDQNSEIREKSELKDRDIELLSNETNQLQTEVCNLKPMVDQLKQQKIELENQVISGKRIKSQLIAKSGAEIEQLQENLADYRQDTKQKAVEIQNLNDEISEQATQIKSKSDENLNITEQVESLQALWKDNQLKLEKQIEKSQALQKLNQQISLNLNQNRREIHRLKDALDGQNFRATEKIKELKGQVDVLGSEKFQAIKTQDKIKPEVLEKIDTLIAEIQSGFSHEQKPDGNSDNSRD